MPLCAPAIHPYAAARVAIELVASALDRGQAWALVERVAAFDPWCLELDEDLGQLRALFPALPPHAVEALRDLAPGAVLTEARAARYGAGWRPAQLATQVGPLWIVAPGRRPPAGARFAVTVDGLRAFGAGTHETTVLCLERLVELSPLDELLDVGTGSGILALAALRLGARRATALDVEPTALAEAGENARANGLAARLDLSLDAPAALGRRFPVVVANVRTPALIALAPALLAACETELILSGVRVEERDELVPTFEAHGARVLRESTRGDWLRIDVAPAR